MLWGSLVLVMLVIATAAVAGRRFRALVARDVRELFANAGPGVGPRELAARWDSLPEPVRRHLRYAIPEGTPAIRTARLRHDGSFRPALKPRWFTIQGRHYATAGRPGFVWNARVRVAPGVWIEARDRLRSGRGNMLVKFWSAFPMVDARGPEIDQGSLLRWLAEAVWVPYGFAGEAIQWEAIDERSARAALVSDGAPVSAVFEVDEEGKFARVSGQRYRDLGGGKAVLTPWLCHCREYREFDGVRVPSQVEVLWVLEGGEFSYARFRVAALEYNVPEPF